MFLYNINNGDTHLGLSQSAVLDTISQQTMHFDRFPGHVRIDLLKYM